MIVSGRWEIRSGDAVTTCFERTNLVLEELANDAEALGIPDVDSLVRDQLKVLTGKYSALNQPGRGRIDYSSLQTQLAYVYRCAATHGDWLYKNLMANRKTVAAAIAGQPVKVACVGGGPGSDMLGIMKFIDRQAISPASLEFVLLDFEKGWFDIWRKFRKTIPLAQRPQISFVRLDLAAGAPWTADLSFLDADIVTFSFSLSECWVFNGKGSVSGFLQEVVAGAKKGTLFVYNDNGGPGFTPNAELAFGASRDLKLISSFEDDRILLSGDEQIAAVAAFKERFGQNPKMVGNISNRVWQKCR